VIAFAPAEPAARFARVSTLDPGFHIRDALADVAARHPHLIGRFGGHAIAGRLVAGISNHMPHCPRPFGNARPPR
jgi:single-stranded-DNA-specific exonuclease